MDNYVHSNINPGQHGRNRGYSGNGGNGGGYAHGRGDLPKPIPPITAHSSDSYPFFLPGGGISREVVQTDLSRYLGNNAQCKPGHDEYVWGSDILCFFILFELFLFSGIDW